MNKKEALLKIQRITNINFRILQNINNINIVFSDSDKGRFGKFLELAIGLTNNSFHLDLDDAEIKSQCINSKKTDLALIKINRKILTNPYVEYKNSKLSSKIKNILFVEISNQIPFLDSFIKEVKDISMNNLEHLECLLALDYFHLNQEIKKNGLKSKTGLCGLLRIKTKGKNSQENNHAFYLSNKGLKILFDKNFSFEKYFNTKKLEDISQILFDLIFINTDIKMQDLKDLFALNNDGLDSGCSREKAQLIMELITDKTKNDIALMIGNQLFKIGDKFYKCLTQLELERDNKITQSISRVPRNNNNNDYIIKEPTPEEITECLNKQIKSEYPNKDDKIIIISKRKINKYK